MARVLSNEVVARLATEGKEVEVVEQVKEKGPFKCPECKFVAKTAFGLQSHMRKHSKDEVGEVGDAKDKKGE